MYNNDAYDFNNLQVSDANNKLQIKEETMSFESSSIACAVPIVPVTLSSASNSTDLALAVTTAIATATTVTTASVASSEPNSGTAVVVAGMKRRANTATEEMETDREGRISSGSSSGSDAENNQDYKRIRFDESIFEEDERERLIREFTDRTTENVDDIGKNCDKLQHEIAALTDLARAKELEWNSIIRYFVESSCSRFL